MHHIEHNDARSSERLENILETAPQAFVDAINATRLKNGQPAVEVRGRPNTEGTPSQLAHTHALLLKRKIELLKKEARSLKSKK